jgi:membrane fusion protein, multidrug efflux system
MLRNLLLGLLTLAAAAGVYLYASAPAPKPASAAAPPPVAVSAVPAAVSDVPLLLSGIGAVQALNTVQLRSRIDGTLDQVNFGEGQQVKEGDVLAKIDPRLYQAALDQAKAKLAQDTAQLASDEKDLERSRQLSQQRFASQQSVDQLTAKVGVDKALIEADRAAIRTAETNLSYTIIKAPFPGRIGLRALDPGNIVKANDTGTTIATLTQQNPIALVFTLAEVNLAAVREAQRAGDVPVIAFDQDGKKPIAKGKLQVIDNQVDQTTGTIRLKAVFDNASEALWPGQYAPVQVQVGALKNAVTAPSAAIQRGPNGLYVWIATAELRAVQAAVETGPAYEGATVIKKGLSEGDQIIVSNQYRLQPNALIQLNAQPVAANEGKART